MGPMRSQLNINVWLRRSGRASWRPRPCICAPTSGAMSTARHMFSGLVRWRVGTRSASYAGERAGHWCDWLVCASADQSTVERIGLTSRRLTDGI